MTKETALIIFLAALPALVWSALLVYNRKDHYKALYFKVFLGGTLTVLPILTMQHYYRKFAYAYPSYDFVYLIKDQASPLLWIVILYFFVATTEEIVKFYIVKFSDQYHPELITNINQALKFGILSALGFAFSENILYFQQFYSAAQSQQDLTLFIVPALFRSVFTVCAHLCFTGIFSYYYGISKFSQDFADVKKWKGESVAHNEYQKIRNKTILTGLSLSIILHAAHNIFLSVDEFYPPITINGHEFNIYIVLTVLLILGMFFFLQFLLDRKTGNLTFILADKHHSTMAKKDEEVILELIGMWFKEGRYEEVEGICDRLLKRDPDNNVVKLFRAEIQDKIADNTHN